MKLNRKRPIVAALFLMTPLYGAVSFAQPQTSNPIPHEAPTDVNTAKDVNANQQQQRVGKSGNGIPWWVPIAALVALAVIAVGMRGKPEDPLRKTKF